MGRGFYLAGARIVIYPVEVLTFKMTNAESLLAQYLGVTKAIPTS